MEAVALYDFKAFESDQLSFNKDDIIKILNKVNDDWFEAELKAQLGVVPANHIAFESPEWYKVLSKEVATSTLFSRSSQECNFLVRPSEASPGEISLSVKMTDVQHFKILRDQHSKYFIWNDAPHFASINKLITYYKNNTVSKTSHVILHESGGKGCGRGGGGSKNMPVVGSGRSDRGVNKNVPPQRTVTAKFDFQSRNEEELTIYEGDLITVIAEVDADWFKGSINRNGSLQTGLFPANYV